MHWCQDETNAVIAATGGGFSLAWLWLKGYFYRIVRIFRRKKHDHNSCNEMP